MQKVPVIRRIPVPIYKKPDESYTNYVQIGMPAKMIQTTASDDYDWNDSHSEEEKRKSKK